MSKTEKERDGTFSNATEKMKTPGEMMIVITTDRNEGDRGEEEQGSTKLTLLD